MRVMWNFLRNSFAVVSKKTLLLIMVNWLFFGSMLVGALFAQAGYLGYYDLPLGEDVLVYGRSDWLFLFFEIFVWNLVVSGFVLVTLSGLLFFALPIVFLFLRAFNWGLLLITLPSPLFFVAFATLVLEGEAYVLASVAGFSLGLSWLKPDWAYKGAGLSRRESLRKALRDCLRLYVWIAVLLFVAALVEVLTIAVLL